MTTSPFSQPPTPGSFDPDHPERTVVRISDPGTLISAVPALLGFHPHRSLVAVCFTGTGVGAVMRHDLELGDGDRIAPPMDLVLAQFAGVADREGADRVLVLMIDDRLPARPHPTDLARHRLLVDEFSNLLWRSDIELGQVLVCPRIVAGAPWWDLGGGHGGTLPDPGSSEVAVAQVVGGRAIRASRNEIEALVAPAAPAVRDRIADRIDDARERRVQATALNRAAADRTTVERAGLDTVLARIAQLEAGDEPDGPATAELALALEITAVRDAVLALALGEQADAAEQLWIHLARVLPDPERAEPLALLGYSAYARGDGPLAGVALGAALAADPCHGLAALLDRALQAGIRPTSLRELAELGHDIAGDLGIALPPMTPLPSGGV
ncbi:DUF4192 domain-containing protein [Prescottella sp. R16]|uniref:DUF4192 domain-containing protein n=1 Tax=Prescottella sp. R16 TaxID=3064529 RepID=UPI00272E6BC2|nr:DUF4192 domain-containing protein [Prescottella sp. R16]